MSLKTILEGSKSKLTALLSFANETTGQSDTNIGDAIRTLCGGYGGGGTSNYAEGTIIGDGLAHTSNNPLILSVNFEPRTVVIALNDNDAMPIANTYFAIYVRDVFYGGKQRSANSTSISASTEIYVYRDHPAPHRLMHMYPYDTVSKTQSLNCAPNERVMPLGAEYKYFIFG